MSTNKHIDKICIIVIALTLVVCILIMNLAYRLSSSDSSGNTMGYENRLFDTSKVHSIDIVIDDWDQVIENAESEEYSLCTIIIDGEKFSNVAIRAKGNTSLSTVKNLDSDRYSFKVEFDHYNDASTYYGLDKLCLNNLIQDNTMMKDYLVYQMMAEFGVDAPLCSYTYITVNGEDWGLYLAVEGVEESFLERNYGDEYGDLYKPDSMSIGADQNNDNNQFSKKEDDADSNNEPAGPDSSTNDDSNRPSRPDGEMPDFGDGNMPDFDGEMPDFGNGNMPEMPDGNMPAFDDSNKPEMGDGNKPDMGGGMGSMGSNDVKLLYTDDDVESYSRIFDNAKTKVTDADSARLISSLKKLSNYEDIESVVDTEEVIRYFVVHNFVCNEDSYTGSMIHNYYLYEEDGQLSMIPWDYNLAFGTFQGGSADSSVNESIDYPYGTDVDERPMYGFIMSDETYTDQYHELYSEFLSEWFDSGKLDDLITETYELIKPYVEKDPTKFCTTEDFETGVATLREFVSLRAEAVSNQLSGDTTEVDTGSLDLSLMGTMNNNRNNEGDSFGPKSPKDQ